MVSPSRHLAGEPRRRRAVDHDEPCPASRLIRGQLQEDSDEVGDRHAEFVGETFSGLYLPVEHSHVELLRAPFHLPARLLGLRVGAGLRPRAFRSEGRDASRPSSESFGTGARRGGQELFRGLCTRNRPLALLRVAELTTLIEMGKDYNGIATIMWHK